MIESALYSILTADSTVSGLISTRVYPIKLPQSPTFPAVTYQRVSTPRVRSTTGPSGLAHPSIQIDCWAETYTGVKSLAEAAREAVDGYSGTVGGVAIAGIIVASENDFFEPEVEIYRVTMDITIWHEE